MNLTTFIRASFLAGVFISIFEAAISKPVTSKWAENQPIESAFNQLIKSAKNPPRKSFFALHEKNLHGSESVAEFLQPDSETHPRSPPLEMLSPPSDADASTSSSPSSSSKSPSTPIVPAKDNVRVVLKEIVQRILDNDINGDVIAKDAKNVDDYDKVDDEENGGGGRLSDQSFHDGNGNDDVDYEATSAPFNLWEELKNDVISEANSLKGEFEQFEKAIVSEILAEFGDDPEAAAAATAAAAAATDISFPKLAGKMEQHFRGLADQQIQEEKKKKGGRSPRHLWRKENPKEKLTKSTGKWNDLKKKSQLEKGKWNWPEWSWPKGVDKFIEKKKRGGRSGRGKRNLLTDLIEPHMTWDGGNSRGGKKLTYQEFRDIATQLVAQLKIDRLLVSGAERETAVAIISALEDLLGRDEAFVTALLLQL